MEETQKYKWAFSHHRRRFLTIFQSNVHGDMNINQIVNSKCAGIYFEQHSERVFFIFLLKYAQEHCRDLSPFRKESGLLSKTNKLPNYAGNFMESITEDGGEREYYFQNDLIFFNPEIKLESFPLGQRGRMEVDNEGNLLLIEKYFGGQDSPPVILPPKQIDKAIFGLIYLASHGLVRTSKRALVDRLNYWRKSF